MTTLVLRTTPGLKGRPWRRAICCNILSRQPNQPPTSTRPCWGDLTDFSFSSHTNTQSFHIGWLSEMTIKPIDLLMLCNCKLTYSDDFWHLCLPSHWFASLSLHYLFATSFVSEFWILNFEHDNPTHLTPLLLITIKTSQVIVWVASC